MSNNEKRDGVPGSFNMALAGDPYAMGPFATLTEEEKRTVIGRTHSKAVDEELRAMLDSYKNSRCGMKEPTGPVQQ